MPGEGKGRPYPVSPYPMPLRMGLKHPRLVLAWMYDIKCSRGILCRRIDLAKQRDVTGQMMQQSIQKIWIQTVIEVYPQAPIEAVRVFATRAINSYIKEYERILAMPVEDLTLADKKLKNSKAHYKVISSNHVRIPSNWRVYIAVISIEEVIKAHLLIQLRIGE